MSSRGRLVLFTLLFLAWIGYLGYLVSQTRDTIVLSRPQFLVSNRVAIVRLSEKDGKAAAEADVVETLKPTEKSDLPQKLTLHELPYLDAKHGWRGPGNYLVPLTSLRGGEEVHITPIPSSPGFPLPRNQLVTVELRKKNVPAEEVMKFAGWTKDEFDRRTKNLPTLLRANVPVEEAETFAKAQDRGAVVLTDADVRIYPDTPEIRRGFASLE